MGNEEIETKNNLKNLVATSAFVLIGIIFARALNYLYKIIIARYFGPEVFGLFSLAFVIISFAISLSSLGMVDGIMRYTAFFRGKRNYSKINYLLKSALSISLISSVFAGAVIFIFSDFLAVQIFNNLELVFYIKILAFIIPFTVLSNILASYLRGLERIGLVSFLSSIFPSVAKFILLVILILFGFEARNSIVFSYLISVIFLAVLSYIIVKKITSSYIDKRVLTSSEKSTITKDLLSFSWPLIFVGILYNIFFWSDSLILGYFIDSKTVGFYNVAAAIASLFSIAPELFMQLYLPLISGNLSKGKSSIIKNITKQITKWVYLVNIPALAVAVFFPGVIINLLFGEQYLSAEIPLIILSIGVSIAAFSSLFTGLISMKGKTKVVLITLTLTAIINIVLDLILTPLYGMIGAASATTIAWAIYTITMFFLVKKYYLFFPIRRILLKITLIIVSLMLILAVMHLSIIPSLINLIITAAVFALFYISLLILTKCFDKEDIFILNSIKSKFVTPVFNKTHAIISNMTLWWSK